MWKCLVLQRFFEISGFIPLVFYTNNKIKMFKDHSSRHCTYVRQQLSRQLIAYLASPAQCTCWGQTAPAAFPQSSPNTVFWIQYIPKHKTKLKLKHILFNILYIQFSYKLQTSIRVNLLKSKLSYEYYNAITIYRLNLNFCHKNKSSNEYKALNIK